MRVLKQKSFFSVVIVAIMLLVAACSTEDPGSQQVEHPFSKSTRVLNLTPEYFTLSGVEEGVDYTPGSTVTLTLTPGEYLDQSFTDIHMEHIYIHVNDKVYIPAFTETGSTSADELSVEIEVPSEDFEVLACYSVQQQLSETGHTMKLEGDGPVRLLGVSETEKYKYFDCYLFAPDAYVISEVQFKVGDGEWQNVNDVTGCAFSPAYNGTENLYNITIRPDYEDVTGDVLLRVEGEQFGRYDIKWENADEKYLDLASSVLPASAVEGEKVTAEINVKPDYYLKSASASVEGVEMNIDWGSYLKFTMPSQDLTVTLDIAEKLPLNYAASANITKAEFYNADDMYYGVPVTKGVPGEKVYLFASVADGFKPAKAKLATGETFGFTYYMPGTYMSEILIPEDAQSVDVSVETVTGYKVSGNENVVFGAGNVYAEGETVSVAIHVPEGMKVKNVTATAAGGEKLDVAMSLPYASFVMPAADVEVAVEYESLDEGEMVSVIGYYDSDVYDVCSTTNYDWDFKKGFEIVKGKTFYVTVINYNWDMYYVGVKIGENVTIYPAQFDDMMGEYSFGKSLVADDDVIIKVGATEESVSF